MTAVHRVVPWLLVLKAADVLVTGSVLFDEPLVAGSLTAALVCAALVWVRWPRPGAAMAAVVLLVLAAGPLYRNHVAFLAWIALLVAISRDEPEQRLLLTVHLSVVYAFATIVKLHPLWLSGEALAARDVLTLGVPLEMLAWATVAVEGMLAVAVWRPTRAWFALAAVTHVVFVIGMGDVLLETLRLAVFNVAILAVWYALLTYREEHPGQPVLAPVSRHRVPSR